MRISDWSSDVCSSDLSDAEDDGPALIATTPAGRLVTCAAKPKSGFGKRLKSPSSSIARAPLSGSSAGWPISTTVPDQLSRIALKACATPRSEEHTSELQSLMRISYAVFCLKKKKQ